MESLLDRLLVTLEIDLEAFALLEVRRGFRLTFDALDTVIIHYVLSGSGVLDTDAGPPLPFRQGSILILPAGRTQAIRIDDGPAFDVSAGEHCSLVKDGILRFDATDGGPTDLRLLCGSMMASTSGSFGLFEQLSAPIAEPFADLPHMAAAFGMLAEEVARPDLGTRAVASAIMKMCLAVLLRRRLRDLLPSDDLLVGFADGRLRRAVLTILDGPARPHTVASLAREAGVSRSAFADLFSRTFSMGPMEFVAKTRLHHAAALLKGTNLPIKVIAGSIGFRSRSHFSRAFRNAYGTDPKSFRQKQTTQPLDAPMSLRGERTLYALKEE